MPIPWYEREEEEYAGPIFSRVYVALFVIAAFLGLLCGAALLVWQLWATYLR